MLNTKQDFENFNKNIENTKKVFELYKLLVKKLCEKYKDTTFLWKMHPRTVKQINSKESNDNSNLNDYFKNFNNFILLNDYRMVEPYIICSEYVLHCNSTCGYQAYILGKKNINYKPIDNLYSSVTTKKHTSYLTGYICKNINEIFDLVDSNFKKKLIINENELEKCIHNLKKNVNSSEDILNELNKINNKNKIDNINIHEIKKILLNFEKIIFKKNEKYERFREERIKKFINIIKKNFNFNYNVKFKININAILLE
jgi:hypothetical protein